MLHELLEPKDNPKLDPLPLPQNSKPNPVRVAETETAPAQIVTPLHVTHTASVDSTPKEQASTSPFTANRSRVQLSGRRRTENAATASHRNHSIQPRQAMLRTHPIHSEWEVRDAIHSEWTANTDHPAWSR